MADSDKFFQITTMPKRSGISGRLTKLYRKRQLVVSVIGAYVLIGGLLGFVLFNSAGDRAKASADIARVTPIIDLVESENKEIAIGDTVEVKLTLQNRSSTDAINNIAVEFFSTKNAVSWNSLSAQDALDGDTVDAQNNVFKLPVLSAGERATFVATGVLQNEESNFLTILAKVRYLNREGEQEVHSNRVFTELESQANKGDDLVSLESNKNAFLPGEEIALGLDIGNAIELNTDFSLEGTVYISEYNNDQLVDSIECIFDAAGLCNVAASIQNPGTYTALFISDDNSYFSNISQFQVNGVAGETAINPQVSLEYPFGSKSINGVVPVFASRVIGLNDTVNAQDSCVFEVLQGDQVVTEVSAGVRSDRTCSVFINAAQITTGDGLYGIRLKGTDSIKEVSIVRKSTNLLTLQTGTNSQFIGSDVNVISSTINDIGGNPISGESVTLGILHRDSGEYKEVNSINGQTLSVENGEFVANIPASYFEKGGLFLINITTENGQISDFLSIDYGEDEVGLVYSGVIVDNYENLQVGRNVTFSLQGITDRLGNTIADGACEAGIYTKSSGSTPLVIAGQIVNGNCSVFVEAGRITEAGPVLVSFTAAEINSDINQSRQFVINPAAPASFGQLNFEYEPVRKDYANNVIVGPLVDLSGNVTDGFGLTVEVVANNEVIKSISDVATEDGFATVTLPASSLVDDNVVVRVFNSEQQEVLSREVVLLENTDDLILPVVPLSVSNDDIINITLPNLDLVDGEECFVRTFQTNGEEVRADGVYNQEERTCSILWDLAINRNNPNLLVVIEAGALRYANIISLQAGEAANLFALHPSTRIDSRDELHIDILSSVITDRYGLPISDGEMRVQYNGKTEVVSIENGLADFAITADELSTKDIRDVFDTSFLDLNLEASASVSSINTTNFMTLFLGDKDVAVNEDELEIVMAQTHLLNSAKTIFGFESEICRAIIVNEDTAAADLLKTHRQGGTCYVELSNLSVPSEIVFEEKGYVLGRFEVTPVFQTHQVRWCASENCIIQVVAPLNSAVEANVYDGDNVYNFVGEELENVVRVSQNGLNPLKDYLVEVQFTNNKDQVVKSYQTIPGEFLNATGE